MSRKWKKAKTKTAPGLAIAAADLPSSLRITGASEGFELLAAAADGQGGEGQGKLRKFAMTAYTGVAMRLPNFSLPVVADLTGMSVPGQNRPILRGHDPDKIVGHTETIELTAQRLKVTGTISGVGEAAQEVVALAANKFPWQASIGASVERLEFVDRGQTVKVNGRSFTGPLYVARATTLGEISFVPMGADSNSSATVAAQERREAMTFEQWVKAQGFDPATLTDGQRTFLQAAYAVRDRTPETPVVTNPPTSTPPAPTHGPVQAQASAVTTPGTPPADPVAEENRRAAANLQRIRDIQRICAGSNSPTIEVEVNGQKIKKALDVHAIEANWDATRTELEVLRAARPRAQLYASGGAQDGPAQANIMEASLCLSAGLTGPQLEKWFDKRTIDAAMTAGNRGASIVTVFAHVITAAGRHYRPGKPDDGFIREAFEANRMLQASGFTTISLPGTLGNVANKALIAAYDAVAVTWPKFCAVRSHNDFKTHTRYRLDSTGSFKKVGPNGELKHIGFSEAGYTNKLDTFGCMAALNRQTIINDDLGAFTQLPIMLGRLGAIRPEEAVWVLLLSNPSSFFSVANKNYMTGGTSALAIDSLTTAKQKFMDQVDSNGKPVLTTPRNLVVPTTLDRTSFNLLKEDKIIDGSATKQPARNPHAGTLESTTSTYINNTGIKDQDGNAIANQSNTRWFLFADPNDRAAIAIAFLNGQRIPTLENAEVDFASLGIQWRTFLDFGVGMEDTVAALMSDGA